MKLPTRPSTLDDTSGYNKNQQNLINSILNSLYQTFASKIMKQNEEDEPLVQKLGTNYSSVLSNLIDRVYNEEAFMSFTLYTSSSSQILFQIKDEFTIENLRWTGISSDSTSYYTLNNYASLNIVSYNNHNYVLFQPSETLPSSVWQVTISADIRESGKNYDSPVISNEGVEYYISSEDDKFKQAKLNSSLDSISQIIYNFTPDKTNQSYSKIDVEDVSTVEVSKEPSNPVYLVANYNGIPVKLGTLLQKSMTKETSTINTEDTNIYDYSWTISYSLTNFTSATIRGYNKDEFYISSLLSTYGIDFTPEAGVYNYEFSIEKTQELTRGNYTYYYYELSLVMYKVKKEQAVNEYKLTQFYS